MNIDTENFGYNDNLSFIADWSGKKPPKKFLLKFYPYDGTIELREFGISKIFVSRMKLDTVTQNEIYINNTLIVFNRLIKILDYANTFTKQLYGPTQEEVLLVLKPIIKFDKYGEILQIIEKNFQIINLRMCKLSREEGKVLYAHLSDATIVPALIDHIISGPCLVVELRALKAREKLEGLLGPSSPAEARITHPNSLRARFGLERTTNGFHLTPDDESTKYEIDLFFKGIEGHLLDTTAVFKNSAMCVVKPHAVKKKKIGDIVRYITEVGGFTITMMQIFYLETKDVMDFFESYKGVVDNFFNFTESFLRGPALILEIGSNDPDLNVFEAFRDFTGLRNPDINNRLKPYTLRAKFGENKYHNAVYCTDIQSSVIEDLKFFFKILQKS